MKDDASFHLTDLWQRQHSIPDWSGLKSKSSIKPSEILSSLSGFAMNRMTSNKLVNTEGSQETPHPQRFCFCCCCFGIYVHQYNLLKKKCLGLGIQSQKYHLQNLVNHRHIYLGNRIWDCCQQHGVGDKVILSFLSYFEEMQLVASVHHCSHFCSKTFHSFIHVFIHSFSNLHYYALQGFTSGGTTGAVSSAYLQLKRSGDLILSFRGDEILVN